MAVLNRCETRDPFFSVVDRFFGQPLLAGNAACSPVARPETALLPVDLSETDTHVIVRAAAPGFTKDEIEAVIHDNVLTIKAEHKEETQEQGERYFRKELRWGSMSRRVGLGDTVIDGDIAAELKDGILTLRLPKAAEVSPKKIKIG